MKTFKQYLNESVPTLTHTQSTTNPDGQLIKIMSDGSQTPFTIDDVEDTTQLTSEFKLVLTDIIKDSIPFYAKPFVEADLDNWEHIMQIFMNWGGSEHSSGFYLPVKYTAKAEKAMQKVIDGGDVHPDINYNAWILELLQGLLDMLSK